MRPLKWWPIFCSTPNRSILQVVHGRGKREKYTERNDRDFLPFARTARTAADSQVFLVDKLLAFLGKDSSRKRKESGRWLDVSWSTILYIYWSDLRFMFITLGIKRTFSFFLSFSLQCYTHDKRIRLRYNEEILHRKKDYVPMRYRIEI